ncbi:sulfatase-like hydrolase/transferase [Chitinophaga sedimenti]|uniref:sulfatase-like hydrolase/transferase n=1 Tax=Chitinophaga sedimenti TaxID=2033606 RepID=UPI00200412D8|nr:sulfatase-like hydrolase/transferase [Chitinophaga sedimenti]MCK7558525.1 sulfatase-like hydrolase/transferase [Chitinophaga sedimenti]
MFKRQRVGGCLLYALFASFILIGKPLLAQQGARPNILVIVTDDQRYNTIHALGNKHVITPNMDRLKKRGVAFTRAHILGANSGAVCAPSRAMLLTGKPYYQLPDCFINGGCDYPTFPAYFRSKGYETFETGKWHNSKEGFKSAFTTADNIFMGGMHQVKLGGHATPRLYHFDSSGQYPNSAQFTGDHFSSEYYADAAVQYLSQKKDSTPFLMYVAFTAPHDPRTPPEKFAKLYDPSKLPLPRSYMPEHPFDNGELTVRDENLLPLPRDTNLVKRELALYYAMITEVDDCIGRVLDALEKNGKDKNTLIIFTADNGLAVGQHGLLGKQNLYDHSMRVPLILSGPGLPTDARRDALCALTDIYPTLCDYAGLPRPEGLEGQSLLPVVKKTANGRPAVFTSYKDVQRAVRTEDNWKLIWYKVKGRETKQLFNLQIDPGECITSPASRPSSAKNRS